jgi:hypothetical protein
MGEYLIFLVVPQSFVSNTLRSKNLKFLNSITSTQKNYSSLFEKEIIPTITIKFLTVLSTLLAAGLVHCQGHMVPTPGSSSKSNTLVERDGIANLTFYAVDFMSIRLSSDSKAL